MCASKPGNSLVSCIEIRPEIAAARSHKTLHRIHRALANLRTVGQIRARHPRFCGKIKPSGVGAIEINLCAQFFGQTDDRLSLWSIVKYTPSKGYTRNILQRVTVYRNELLG